VRGHDGRVVVRFSWSDAAGRRVAWSHVLRLDDGRIVDMEDVASGRGARRVARLFERRR
jgi:hypothetical protein